MSRAWHSDRCPGALGRVAGLLRVVVQGSGHSGRSTGAQQGAAHQLQPHVPSLRRLQKMFSD